MEFFKSQQFSQHVSDLMEEWHVAGLAIAVVQNETYASKGFGYADLSEPNPQPVTPDTVFDIASSSKSLTAAAVAFLVEDDENYPDVKWNTPISKLLPEDFVMAQEEYTNGVTVEDILCHRTGLPSHDLSYMSPRAQQPDTLKSVTRNIRNLEIAAPIRSKFMYCNMMYTVAAYLVEHLSGLAFDDFLRKYLWQPLEMSSTNLQPRNALEAGLPVAQPYKWDDQQSTYTAVERQHSPEAAGAGLVVTSVNDYIKWVRVLMNQEHPISEDIYSNMTKPRSFEKTENLEPLTSPTMYGLGLEIKYYRGHAIVSHDGGDPGVATSHFFLPEFKFGGVLLGNAPAAGDVIPILIHELVDEVIGMAKSGRINWNTRQRELMEKEDREEEEEKQQLRQKLCQGCDPAAKAHKIALRNYVGLYRNVGYHDMRVELKDTGSLTIDATDRTMGFTIILEHLCKDTQFIAHLHDYYEGGDREIAAEFTIEDGKIMSMGLDLEDDSSERRIWFIKAEDASLPDRSIS